MPLSLSPSLPLSLPPPSLFVSLPPPFSLSLPLAENELSNRVQEIASMNEVYRSYLGEGYYGCIVPPVIKRNILENPGW